MTKELLLAVCLLPAVFMLHDFEDIVLMQPWLINNSSRIKARFPRLAKHINHASARSTAAFALAVAEEFILICLVTALSVWYSTYGVWVAVYCAFFLHLLLHIGQSIVLKSYIPALATSILSLPYCVWVGLLLVRWGQFDLWQTGLLFALGSVLVAANLLLALKTADWFDKQLAKYAACAISTGEQKRNR